MRRSGDPGLAARPRPRRRRPAARSPCSTSSARPRSASACRAWGARPAPAGICSSDLVIQTTIPDWWPIDLPQLWCVSRGVLWPVRGRLHWAAEPRLGPMRSQAPPRRARRCPSVAQLLCMKARRCTCLLLPYTRHPDVVPPVAYAVLGSLQSTRLLPLPCRRNPKAPTPALCGDPAALGSAEAAHALAACMPRRAQSNRCPRACAVHAA